MSPLEDEAGDVLQKARYGRGMTQAEAARLIGVPLAALQAVEDLRRPVTEAFLPLAEALGLRGSALLAMAEPEAVTLPLPPSVHPFRTPFGSWTYLVQGPEGLVLFDPAAAPEAVLPSLRGRPLAAVLVTHGHRDHLQALDAFREQAGVAAAHPDLAAVLGISPLRPGETIAGFTALAAPGHTPDGLAYLGRGLLVTGDALFARSAGRAATPSAYGEVLATVGRLLALAEDTLILPGHGPPSTVRLERRLNPFFPS